MLDRIDRAIIEALVKNARLPNKVLAARVGVAQSTCLERVRRLHQRGILVGYHAEVDKRSLGISLEAMVAIRLAWHSRELVDSFRRHALGLAEVLGCYHMAGANDFLLHVAVRDAEHLRDLTLSSFTTRPEVDHIETALIFEHATKARLPIYLEEEV